jgi:aspartate/methionine/tyrosine aminotransferase
LKDLAERAKSIGRPLHRAIKDYAVQMNIKDMIYLSIGEPDFPTPSHITEAAKKALDEGFTHYTPEGGILELRQAIANRLETERGLHVDPKKDMLITSGGAEACFVAITGLLDPGDEVIIPEPFYPPYVSTVNIASGRPVLAPVDSETLMVDPDIISKLITNRTKAIIINNPCNPTGMTYGRDVLKCVADMAVDHDLYVISDEVYDRFVYEVECPPSIAAFPGMQERTLVINSLSKTYAMTGWRVGYLASTPEIIEEILKVKGAVNVCANAIAQKAALVAVQGSDECVDEMVKEYANRRKVVLEGLNQISGLQCPNSNGAFYVFPDVSNIEMDSLKLSKYLIERGHVVVSPGVGFGKSGEGHVRISYSASMENLKEALKRMKEALEAYGK